MIDPKLNELPVEPSTQQKKNSPTSAETPTQPRPGLSIRDTIAGDTLLSVGSRGVDVSGVEAGAGAGSGSTSLTPGLSSSPAPEIVPGGRATGTTPRGASSSGRSPAADGFSDANAATDTTDQPTSSAFEGEDDLPHHEVAARAYECWCERGCPEGSPELDWHRAIEDVRSRRNRGITTAGRTNSASA